MRRNASLAPVMAPSRFHMTMPTTLASTRRRTFASSPLAADVRRFAIPGQQTQASRVTLRNIQDRFSQCLKYGGGRIGQCGHQLYELAVLLFVIRRTRGATMQLLGAQDRLKRSSRK